MISTASFIQALQGAGFDLVQPFDAARYNERIAARPALPPLPLFGRSAALAFAVGNSRALWPRFIEAVRQRPELAEAAHPLDRYTSEAIREAAALLSEPGLVEIRFSYEVGPNFVSMLDVAGASGLAHPGPAFLAVHPEHGPWIALRAVVVLDHAPTELPSAAAKACCDGCDAPCLVALGEAKAAGSVEGDWRRWVKVRDACPVGTSSRYSEAQLRYHYTKDRSALSVGPVHRDR